MFCKIKDIRIDTPVELKNFIGGLPKNSDSPTVIEIYDIVSLHGADYETLTRFASIEGPYNNQFYDYNMDTGHHHKLSDFDKLTSYIWDRKNAAAAALGSVRSDAKTAAARENAKQPRPNAQGKSKPRKPKTE